MGATGLNARTRPGSFALAAALIVATLYIHASSPAEAGVVHVVLVWLKEPGNPAHRQHIIEVTRTFAELPGVVAVRVGEPVLSDREIVDDSFDVGLYLTFANADDMRAYLIDERHQAAVQEIFMPLSERYIAYDFEDSGQLKWRDE
jgi:hypothetical protein